MTLFNYWHFIVLAVVLILFVAGMFSALKQKKQKMVLSMAFSVTIMSLFLAFFSILVVDKYTKEVKLYKLKNKRLLSTEQIIYTGIVKNVGNHKIGKVKVEIKIVNKGNVTGSARGVSYFKSSGFFDFFSSGSGRKYRLQTITKEFVVAKNLKPGAAKSFRVHFKYPPYFRSVSDVIKVSAH